MHQNDDDRGNRIVTPLHEVSLLEEVVRALVRDPSSVRVTEEASNGRVYLYIHTNRHDKKHVIGRRGNTISSIRKIFSAIGALDGKQIIVEIAD